MILKLKEDFAHKWCVVEKFNTYVYQDILNVSHIFNIFSEPMIYKGGFFSGLSMLDQKVGTAGYIKAKKPFYSILDENSCLVEIKIKYDKSGNMINLEVYLLKPLSTNGNELYVQRVKSNFILPGEFKNILIESKGDREIFLNKRKEFLGDVKGI